MSIRRFARTLAPVAFLAAGACVATRNDLRLVQNDVAVLKAEQALADSARRAQLDRVIAQLGLMSDSLNATTARINRFQGDVRQQMYAVEQQLVTIQELTGQSQRRLQELRASMEQRATVVPSPAPAGGAGASQPSAGAPSGPAPTSPGPNQLFQLALDQLRRGSTGAARAGFSDLLRQYPTADIAPDAQFYVAEAYAAEGNASAADSVYALVAERYPASMRAGTALYKRAISAQAAGRSDDARALFTAVIERFPRSDEAVLARDRLRTLK